MRDFLCPNCGQQLTFENSECLRCGTELGFDLDTKAFVPVADGARYRRCRNRFIAVCNWAVPVAGSAELCVSCSLTRTRPSDDDAIGLPEFADAEAAKRRLVMELSELGLPITGRDKDPERGLCFDLLSSAREAVITGHDEGVITLDLAESDDVHREQLRTAMDEPYRTLLGHFRHETGHYYYFVLAETGQARRDFEVLFGDPDSDYQAALDRHYSQGAPSDWEQHYISAYATMHPAEDWAETFAHYLHIRDTIDTAAAFGFAPAGATVDKPLAGDAGFDRIVELWLPLSWSLNMINRSMGHHDLYPFVVPPAAWEKMRLVHNLIGAASVAAV
ncbi:putative zinc-binding metallopeptidase [Jatrophihabitans sp.]|uniref:zinc-binding metallopeptidase family protein n=1 Tax=Jatrophihabitans sp. TaxID=1932789 RepID=UPI0030C6AE30